MKDKLKKQLEEAGFSFHHGEAEHDDGSAKEIGWWWVFGRTGWSGYECGDTFTELDDCLLDAVRHTIADAASEWDAMSAPRAGECDRQVSA